MCLSLEHQKPLKTSEKMGYFDRVTVSFYTFYRPQTKRLKGRKQIWGRFSNPWNSNGIEWNRLILLTWSRILMYLPNTVGKRHKKAFKFIFGDRNLRLRDSAFARCARNRWWRKWRSKVNVLKIGAIKGKPTRLLPHAKILLVPRTFFSLFWVDYALEGSTFSLSKCDFSGDF